MVTLKEIKKELEKLKTLDEKRAYLEKILQEIKDPKLKQQASNLLKEVILHLEHEKKLSREEKLEQKLTSDKPNAREIAELETISPAGFSPVKYVPRRRAAEEESPLERQARAGVTGREPTNLTGRKYEPPSATSYHSRQDTMKSLQMYFEQQWGTHWREHIDEFSQRDLREKVGRAIGLSQVVTPEEKYRVESYISQLKGKKDGDKKYEARK
ncbi:MAG TPA: hypothetical protein VJ110_02095 [Candidatus Nanoarchaeia archaeon]|nr:hypothetical protein [Candidatus Nanoarchaeia archaeon]